MNLSDFHTFPPSYPSPSFAPPPFSLSLYRSIYSIPSPFLLQGQQRQPRPAGAACPAGAALRRAGRGGAGVGPPQRRLCRGLRLRHPLRHPLFLHGKGRLRPPVGRLHLRLPARSRALLPLHCRRLPLPRRGDPCLGWGPVNLRHPPPTHHPPLLRYCRFWLVLASVDVEGPRAHSRPAPPHPTPKTVSSAVPLLAHFGAFINEGN